MTGCPSQWRRGRPADGWHGPNGADVRPKVSTKIDGAIRKRLPADDDIMKVAKTLGVGVSAVQRDKAEMPAVSVGCREEADVRARAARAVEAG